MSQRGRLLAGGLVIALLLQVAYPSPATSTAPYNWRQTQGPIVGSGVQPNKGVDFGAATAMSKDGSVMVVGAPFYNSNSSTDPDYNMGAFWVYTKQASGEWLETQGPVQPKANKNLGSSFASDLAMSLDGRVLAVGARTYPGIVGGVTQPADGAVWVYVQDTTTGIYKEYQGPFSPPELANTGAEFGSVVSLNKDGKVLAVGTYQGDSAYVYWRDSKTGKFKQKGSYVQPDDRLSTPSFARALDVSPDGKLLAVSEADIGKVWLFAYSSNTKGEYKQDYVQASGALRASGLTFGTDFGTYISFSGNGKRMVVGANNFNSGTLGGVNGGAVWVYERKSASQWVLIAGPLLPVEISPYIFFGSTLDMSYDGKMFAVAGTGYKDGQLTGAVWVFRQEKSGGWKQTNERPIEGSGSEPGSYFGRALSLSGDGRVLLVGAPGITLGTVVASDLCAAYIFTAY